MDRMSPNHFWKGLLVAFVFLAGISQSFRVPAYAGNPPAEIAAATPTPKPQKFITYLPVLKSSPQIKATTIWTADAKGIEKLVFVSGETIRFYSSGFNISGDQVSVLLDWAMEGPCGNNALETSSVELTTENWMKYKAVVAPPCPGIYTYTLKMVYQGQTSTLSMPFVINLPSEVVISEKQAFDKCNIPTTTQMQKWWDKSPYYGVNLYIGGISRGCSNSSLDAFWVNTVSQQGWEFIPTWVGPQAPCSSFKYRMTANTSEAYTAGRVEADAAVAAASQLGLSKDRVIYYDLEGYYGATLSCRAAVNSFLKGWVERLHELNVNAGVYGASCSSYMTDWASINPAPDNVWIAHWYKTGYYGDATVWGARCLSDSLWTNYQRIRQYAGDHTETWGSVSMTIDSNISGGPVNILPLDESASSLDSRPGVSYDPASGIEDFQLLSEDLGWVLVKDRLLWTVDGGSTWKDITPGSHPSLTILNAYFVDNRQGWAVTRDGESLQLRVYNTSNAGESWEESIFTAYPLELHPSIQAADLDFVDPSTGWIVLKLATSSNFNVGLLFKTTDGGKTWNELSLPVGGRIKFITAEQGWVAGGAAGNQLYMTLDGGRTWEPQSLPVAEGNLEEQRYVGLPDFGVRSEGNLTGILPVTVLTADESYVELYHSQNAGLSWDLAASLAMDPGLAPSGPVSVDAIGGGRWVVASPALPQIVSLSQNNLMTPLAMDNQLPEDVVQLDFHNPFTGWTKVENGSCSGDKPEIGAMILEGEQPFICESRSQLFKTGDGGQTWIEITP